jgi:protein-tyrosine phosphatase
MIDIHCHILPGLDDGPDELEETLEMCRLSLADGITEIVATPHLYQGMFDTDRESILRTYEKVCEALDASGIPLKLHIGADLHLTPELVKKIEEREALTLNHGRYFLLELPHRLLPPNLNELISDLVSIGLVQIITHPERNEAVLRKEEAFLELLRSGALCQVTAMSVTGEFGKECEHFACSLIEAGAAHFIASDAHSTGWRGPGLSGALQVAGQIVGEEAAGRLVREHPQAVLSGGDIDHVEVTRLPKRKKFWFF